jgi:hypothetical protein
VTVNFRLNEITHLDPSRDHMGRSWNGYRPGQSDQVTYEQNRGMWRLAPGVRGQRVATFSFAGRVIAVVEIDGQETLSAPTPDQRDRQAVVGRVLGEEDQAYVAWIGQPVDGHRNPVTYLPDLPTGGASETPAPTVDGFISCSRCGAPPIWLVTWPYGATSGPGRLLSYCEACRAAQREHLVVVMPLAIAAHDPEMVLALLCRGGHVGTELADVAERYGLSSRWPVQLPQRPAHHPADTGLSWRSRRR